MLAREGGIGEHVGPAAKPIATRSNSESEGCSSSPCSAKVSSVIVGVSRYHVECLDNPTLPSITTVAARAAPRRSPSGFAPHRGLRRSCTTTRTAIDRLPDILQRQP